MEMPSTTAPRLRASHSELPPKPATGVQHLFARCDAGLVGKEAVGVEQRLVRESADTFADGLATRATYDLTWDALREGLAGFVAVPDAALAGDDPWLRSLKRQRMFLLSGVRLRISGAGPT